MEHTVVFKSRRFQRLFPVAAIPIAATALPCRDRDRIAIGPRQAAYGEETGFVAILFYRALSRQTLYSQYKELVFVK